MRILDKKIVDDEGRALILRGVNLGGSSKSPMSPPGWGLGAESLKNPAEASFTGRPFPLEEAEAHFDRLHRRGLTFIRLVITWEALEHAGPGIYDEAYLAYLRKLLLIAEEKGISIFIDPHQDVWSRWTGGDGAPAWTLEALGIDLDKLDETGSALTRQRYGEFHRTKKHPEGEPYPRMVWPSNYNRYAAATLFTLFFAGNTYAPDVKVAGESVQDWLQGHYIAAMRHCYRRLKNCAAIAGWGSMNEPYHGFAGHNDLEQVGTPVIPLGPSPTPWETMRAASGYWTQITVYGVSLNGKPNPKGHEVINPHSVSLFKEGYNCPWKQQGIWTDAGGEPRLLKKDHFANYQGRPVHFADDFLKPFVVRYIEKMREANEKTLFFIEGVPSEGHPTWKQKDPPNAVNAFHWYDGFTLFTKFFSPWFNLSTKTGKLILGRKKVADYYLSALREEVTWTANHMENIPCLLGEFGLPFDLNERKAFKTGDYALHEEALSLYYNAIDANLLHSTIWNYTADNTHAAGDGWNDEDLSIFSEGKERAMGGWLRPYPMATAGTPLSITWNRKKQIFTYRYRADNTITAPTEIFLPAEYFGDKVDVKIELVKPDETRNARPNEAAVKPAWEYSREAQRLFITVAEFEGEVEVKVSSLR
ncbi:MAG: cellulase family glycosylhydrolase [Treponema sp.]|jgi:hypothetical protein|nr:cellulase family glycosylhydrolase [Treponema sp.]